MTNTHPQRKPVQEPQAEILPGEEAMLPDNGLSEYEMQRRRTIERNHRKLRELGLVDHDEVAASSRTPKRGQTSRIASPTSAPGAPAVRRSPRAKGQTAPVYTDTPVGFDDVVGVGIAGSNGGRKRARSDAIAPRPREQKPLPPDSSRNLECDVPRLVEDYLGRRFPAFGKGPVMDISTKTRQPKFSRMSGVTEWKNAVFLWVNVGEGGGGYTNLFEGSVVGAGRKNDAPSPISERSTEQVVAGVSEDSKHAVELNKNATAAPGCCRAPERPSTQSGSGRNGRVADATVNGRDSEEDFGGAELTMTWYAGGRMTAQSALIRRLIQGSGSESAVGSAAIATVLLSDDARVTETDPVKVQEETTAAIGTARRAATVTLPKLAGPENGINSRVNHDAAESQAVTTATTATDDGGPGLSGSDASAVDPSLIDDGRCEDAVLLFCRLPKEPYVFCGRLMYAEHWPGEQPVRFKWRLVDAGRLAGCPDFGAIVDAAGVEAEVRHEGR